MRRRYRSSALFWGRFRALGLRNHGTLVDLDYEPRRVRAGHAAAGQMVDSPADRLSADAVGRGGRGQKSEIRSRRGGRRRERSEYGTEHMGQHSPDPVDDETAEFDAVNIDGPDPGLLPDECDQRTLDVFVPGDGFRPARIHRLAAAYLRQLGHLAGLLDLSRSCADVLGQPRLVVGKNGTGETGSSRRGTGA